MNITITVTFVNQATLCRAFFFSSPEKYRTSLVPSSTLICTCLIFTWEFLTAPPSLTMWSSWLSFKMNPSEFYMAKWIIFAVTGISVCSPLFKTPFTTVVLDGFLLLMKGLSLRNWLPFPSFFWLGVTNDAAKPDCIVPIGDDGSLNKGCSSGEPIIIKINETQLSWKQQSSQNANTGNHTLISWTMLIGFHYFRETTC